MGYNGFAKAMEIKNRRYVGCIFALLGGIIGIIIGYFLWTSTKTLPNGNKAYAYSSGDRARGKTLFFFATIVMLVWIILRVVFVF